MARVVTGPSRLAQYEALFLVGLRQALTRVEPCRIAWRPSHVDDDVCVSERLGLWWYSVPPRNENRWWNAFGLFDLRRPRTGDTLQIVCQITVPFEGINRHMAGAFLEDNGRVLLAHRGTPLGGGRRGVTRELFWNNYSGPRIRATDEGRENEFAIVSELNVKGLAENVVAFVQEVRRIKLLV